MAPRSDGRTEQCGGHRWQWDGWPEEPRARTELIASDWSSHGEGLVRALGVVDGTPAIEGALSMRQIAQVETGDDVGFEGAMKTFVLALSLRVTRAAMNDADAAAQEPHPESGPALEG